MSCRRALALVSHLPRESATTRAVLGESSAWGDTEHLLAAAVDALNAANWQRAGDKKQPRPKPVPRPGERRAKRRSTLSTSEIERRLLAQQERRRSDGD